MNSNFFQYEKGDAFHRKARSGIIMPMVIVCLTFSAMVVLNVVKATTAQSRQVRHFEQRLQLQVLVDDALEHALIRYDQDSSYQGEQWNIPEEDWGLDKKGNVKVSITKDQSGITTFSAEGNIFQGTEIFQKITRTTQL